jgi:hypothetical protein
MIWFKGPHTPDILETSSSRFLVPVEVALFLPSFHYNNDYFLKGRAGGSGVSGTKSALGRA